MANRWWDMYDTMLFMKKHPFPHYDPSLQEHAGALAQPGLADTYPCNESILRDLLIDQTGWMTPNLRPDYLSFSARAEDKAGAKHKTDQVINQRRWYAWTKGPTVFRLPKIYAAHIL